MRRSLLQLWQSVQSHQLYYIVGKTIMVDLIPFWLKVVLIEQTGLTTQRRQKSVIFYLSMFWSPGPEGSGQRPNSSSLWLSAGVWLRGKRFNRRLCQLTQLHQLRWPGLRLPQRLGPSLQEAGWPLRRRGRWLRAEKGAGWGCRRGRRRRGRSDGRSYKPRAGVKNMTQVPW